MADESIEVGYRNIGSLSGIDYHHKFLIYTDQSGQQHTISGWTDDANTSKELPFGNMQVLANAPYDASNPDSAERHPDQKQFREPIAQGADLSGKWAEMVENAQGKDNTYPYDPIRQNSNTLADSVIRDAGLRQPTQDGLTGHLAPGSDKPLDPNLKPRSSDELGISNMGEAISLNNNQPAATDFRLALSPQSQQLLAHSEQHVRALTDRHQLVWNQGMDNTVHAVALDAREQGLTGITHLTARDGQIRYAQQDGFGIREGQVDASVAANTDAAASLTQMARTDQREPSNAQVQAAPQLAEARSHEAPVRSV